MSALFTKVGSSVTKGKIGKTKFKFVSIVGRISRHNQLKSILGREGIGCAPKDVFFLMEDTANFNKNSLNIYLLGN